MSKLIFASIGWLGVVLCTLGYLLLSMKVIRAESWAFQWLNIVSGFCLAAMAFASHDIPNSAANLLWMFIGAFALSQQSRRKDRAGNR